RKTSMDDPWLVLDTLLATQSAYTDTLVHQGTMYYYSLRAVDFSGNESGFAHPVAARPYDSGVRPPVEHIRVTRNTEDETVQLSWEYPLEGEDVFFVIYRQNERGQFLQHQRTYQRTYEESLSNEDGAVFAVKAFTTDGGQSRLSEAAVVPDR
ncbi:hypothetical protein QLX67_12825, partial [Balneolaceae bacterium ANBcel3]|nr:hypothetical protein [Balneolaceae bacterium ANBcel3]